MIVESEAAPAPEAVARTLARLAAESAPAVVLLTDGAESRVAAPLLAEALDAPLFSDVVDIEAGDEVVFTRLPYTAKVIERATAAAPTVVATVRPKALPVPRPTPPAPSRSSRPRPTQPTSPASCSPWPCRLRACRSGRGGHRRGRRPRRKGPEGFAVIESLADALGAAVGASRRPWTRAGSTSSTRWARRARPWRPRCTSPAAFPAPSSTWPAWAPRSASWPSTRIPRRRSSPAPTTASSRISSRPVPLLEAAVRERK